MKLCILMCGLKRSFDEVKNTLYEHIFDKFLKQNATIDVFIHTDKKIEIKYLKGSIIKNIQRNAHVNGIPFPQFIRQCECYKNLIIPYMKKNNIEYDFYICIRPDYIYFKNCIEDINKWNKDKVNSRVRCYPTLLPFNYHTGFLNGPKNEPELYDDQFFIIPKKIVSKALSINTSVKFKRVTWGELMLTKIFKSKNIEFHIIPLNAMLHNWKHDKKNIIYKKRCKLNLYENIYWNVA